MANYATLKAAIQDVIKTNGNNEITGALLQQSLLAMINSLGYGYQYMGLATPTTNPGTPDQNVFYLASTAGTYTNFDALVLTDGEIAILKYNGAWSKDSTGAASLEKVNQLGQEVIYDVSANNGGTTYANLASAIAAVPNSLHLGGITIRFISSSSQKYEQYRLINSQWSNDVSKWQGEDKMRLYNPVLSLPVKTAMSKYEDVTLRNKLIGGTVGSPISPSASYYLNDARTAVISLDGISSVEYPVYKTSSEYGSFIIDATSTIVVALINTTEEDGTIETVDTSAYSSGGYKMVLSVRPYSQSYNILLHFHRVETYIDDSIEQYVENVVAEDINTPSQFDSLSTLSLSEISDTVDTIAKIIGIQQNVSGQFTQTVEKQAYGNVGSVITTGTLHGCSYYKIDSSAIPSGYRLLVSFETMPANVSSYVQYVNASNIITRRLFESAPQRKRCLFVVDFREDETSVYISGAYNMFIITRVNIDAFANNTFTELEEQINNLSEEVEEIVAEEYPPKTTSLISEIMVKYENAALRNCFITGTVNNKVETSAFYAGNDVRNAIIPLDGVVKVKYPVFKTTSGYGCLIIDNNDNIVSVLINTSKETGTVNEVDTSNYSEGGYKFIFSCYPYSSNVNSVITLLLHNDISLGNVEKPTFALKEFGEMPSCLSTDTNCFLPDGVNGGGDALVSYSDVLSKYDALVSAYPDYVTKTELGYDASGTIMMYSYTFKPKYWKQSIYLQAGIHGWEPDPVFALAEIMYLISNANGNGAGAPYKENDNVLLWLRENVKFTVVPVVNPWGFNDRGDCVFSSARRGQNNYNNVQLGANWFNNNPEPECEYVETIINSLRNELTFSMDMHSTVHSDSRELYGCFYAAYIEGAKNAVTIMRVSNWLYNFYNVKYPSIVDGDTAPNPLGGGYASIGKSRDGFAFWCLKTHNIQSSTIELSDHVWTNELHTQTAMSVAVNMFLNHIIQQVCDGYNIIDNTELLQQDIYNAKA